ncbi:glyoxalase [Nocardia sp. NPDC051570]|uniref:glyoxalase n=1 Tax=Nocardia sp. NPDC051570 TaxID=3364324 RepID=UPI0037B5B130
MSAAAVPVLWSGDLSETLEFYRTLGYTVTYENTRPYTYGIVIRDGSELHFGRSPRPIDAAAVAYVGCVVFVEEVEDLHAEFSAALRTRYGRIPAQGVPRITRCRPGQSRFTVVDPVGNSVTYIRRGEPDVEYGGSKSLTGLARVLDHAHILRDFKTDDRAAARVLETGLRRYALEASVLDRARAMAMLAELSLVTDDSERANELRREIDTLDLSGDDRTVIAAELRTVGDLERWLRE